MNKELERAQSKFNDYKRNYYAHKDIYEDYYFNKDSKYTKKQAKEAEVTLPDKLDYVTEYARSHRKFGFRALLKKQSSKVQVVVTFLAILQLMKEGVIFIEQDQPFDEIMITSKVEEV